VLTAIASLVLAVMVFGISWLVGCLGAMGAIGFGVIILFSLQPWMTQVDATYTLGDAALQMTTAKECQEAGYHYTRNEIFLKVRMILMEAANLDRDEITPEKRLQGDLGLE